MLILMSVEEIQKSICCFISSNLEFVSSNNDLSMAENRIELAERAANSTSNTTRPPIPMFTKAPGRNLLFPS